MKILLLLLTWNILHTVCTQFSANLNYNPADGFHNYFNLNNNARSTNAGDRGKLYHYHTYESPRTQNQLTISNNVVLNQNAADSNQRSTGTGIYQIIQLTTNENPFTQNHYTTIIANSGQKGDINRNQRNSPVKQYKAIEIRHPNADLPQGRSFPAYFVDTKHYSSNELPNTHSSIVNPSAPLINVRFNNDDASESTRPSLESYNSAALKKEQPSAETFQYQYNKGWSIHEAISVDDIVIPHLEERKYSKYSTPNAPEAHYYQKFYDIYNHVEHQTKQDLGQYEMESINDDFNGRSIVAPGQYPHMAAVGFLSNEEKIEFKCGGSLISKSFVITAAHCCYLNGETPIIVKLGIINLKFQSENSEPQRRAIKEIIVHPSYNSTMNYHDIALLKLQTPVEFTKFVRPILLWSSDDIPYKRVFTMGYGSTSFAKAPTNILTELSLSIIPPEMCKEILPSDEKAPDGIVESQICGRDLERNRDTCQGDSGGPLQLNLEHHKQRNIYRYYLVGIISYGEFCGSQKPGVYTRVSSYCKWIASVVWPNFEM